MSAEMKKLIIGGTEYEIVDESGRTRISALEQGTIIGGGLSQIEKDYLLELFEKAAYASNDASTAFDALSALWADDTVYRTVSWSGTGYTKGNAAARVEDGAAYTSTITANTGFNITAVTVTMGGTEVQGAWSNGTVTIPNVTGDIVITVTTSQITVSSISAVYTQSGTVYDSDSLDSLKSDLVVTATFTDSSTGVISAADYTLSGTLTEGTSTITASYGGKTTTFNVTVSTFSTEPSIAAYDSSLNSSGSAGAITGACYTNAYEFELDIDAIKETQYYDSTNNYSTTGGVMYQIKYYTPDSVGISFGSRGKTCHFDSSGNCIAYTSPNKTAEASVGDARQKTQYFTLSDNIVGIKFSLTTADIDDSYAYFDTTLSGIMPIGVRAGDVIFAGRNTQYYGKRNIND